MNSLVVLVAAVASLVQSGVCSHYAGAHAVGAYHGPAAPVHVLPSGFLADTPEVAAAKSAHLSLVHGGAAHGAYAHGAGAYAHGAYAPGVYGGHGTAYHGPLATPVVLPSGYLADTPEVAAVKGAHLSALAHGGAAAGYGHGYGHGYAAAPYAHAGYAHAGYAHPGYAHAGYAHPGYAHGGYAHY